MSDPIEVIIEEQTVQVNLPDGVAAVGGILSAVRAVEDNVQALADGIVDSTDDAEAAALLAQKWASEDEDTVVADGKYSAAHHALKAADFTTAAEGFADDAEGFKDLAEAAETATDTLKTETNTLKLAAESARDTAVTAKNASESARDITLTARDVVTAAETNVETLESTVAGYVATAETAKDDAETAQLAAEAAETNAAASESAADADRIAAQTARTGAETAETNAEAAQAAAESAQAASESARTDALAAQSAAEAAQSGAETAESNASDSADAAAVSYASLAGEVTQAEDAADLAEEWANNPENTVVTGTSNYSAKHWAIQAQASATGALIYRGSYNASSDTAPAGPNELGDYYKISVAGDFGGHEFKVGDSAIYNGSGWDKVDNTESVTSVAGRLGDVVLVKGDVGLGNVVNVDQTNATNITSGTLASARLPATIAANTTGNAATATEADTLDGEHGAYYLAYGNFTGTPTIPDAEAIQDIVGAMVGSNTETGITVTYQDDDGTLDFVLTDGGAAAVSAHTSTYDHASYDTHIAAEDNPHSVTAAQVGADAIGTAAAAVGTHESIYNHSTYLTETSADVLYLGLTGQAADAALLNGEAASYYLDYNNFTNTPSTIDAEQVEDIVGAMVTGNTETGITVTYDDADGTLDFVLTDGGTAAVGAHTSTYDHDAFVTTAEADAAYLASDGTADDSDLLQGQNGAYYLAYGNLTGTPSIPNTESIQDIVGAMFSGNTETRITATYQDGDGTIDLVVSVSKSDVGLGNVSNVDTTNASNISSGTLASGRLPPTIAANTTGNAATATNAAQLGGQSPSYYLNYNNLTNTPSSVSSEEVQDIVGAMFSGNTESGITATYQDIDGTIDLVVSVSKADVGLGNVANVDTTNASNISSGTLASGRLPSTIAANTTGNAATATNASNLGGYQASYYPRVNVTNTFTSPQVFNSQTRGNTVALGGATAINVSSGNHFTKTITTTTTFIFTGLYAGFCCFALRLYDGGSYTVNWPASLQGSSPELTSDDYDVLVFMTDDAGTNWYYTHSIKGTA